MAEPQSACGVKKNARRAHCVCEHAACALYTPETRWSKYREIGKKGARGTGVERERGQQRTRAVAKCDHGAVVDDGVAGTEVEALQLCAGAQ